LQEYNRRFADHREAPAQWNTGHSLMSMLARFGGGGDRQRDPKLAAILVSDNR
jgi:hypothetical protein